MENRDMNLFDFVLLCAKAIGRFFKFVVRLVLQTARLSYQYFWIVGTCVVLGVLGGWLWGKPFATKFDGRATIMYAEGMREVVQEGLIHFLTLSKEEKIEYGVSKEMVEAFRRLDIYNIVDCNADSVPDFVDRDWNVNLADTMNVVMRDRVQLSLKSSGRTDFKSFENALINFFNSQPYLLEADRVCKMIQQERLDYFTKEVARLDSFSTYDYFVRPRYLGVEKGSYVISEREQELYYQDVIVALKNKNYLEMQKMSTPEVINFKTPFVVYAMPLIYKYAIGLAVGVVFGVLLALAFKFRAIIFAYLKEK